MKSYDPKTIEEKWQKQWEKEKLYLADDDSKKEKFYCLDMFPYPSGEGLHVGHWRGFVLSDMIARYQKLNGKNVLHPMGWDAFGLPAENAAIKEKSHPKVFTNKAISNFRRQIKQMGTMIDWSREISTTEPAYYKWTQWLFLQLYKNGLAYRKKAPVNWCPACQTVLANEQAVAGECERCGSKVIKKDLTQWFFKITDFAEDLLNDLDDLDWPERTKTLQRNWIGKSEGALIKFSISESNETIDVFTTRTDTLFGATFVVLAPENPIIDKLKAHMPDFKLAEDYINKVKNKSELERESAEKEKTGFFTGLYAINPINDKKIPIWIADYVLMGYGTGACMCVPAHDERDWDFAKKYKLPIKEVIVPKTIDQHDPPKEGERTVFRNAIQVILINPKNKKVLCLKWKKFPWTTFITGGLEKDEDVFQAAEREVLEETGYKNIKFIKKLGGLVESNFYANHKQENRQAMFQALVYELENEKMDKVSAEEQEKHSAVWLSWQELENDKNIKCSEYDIWVERFNNPEHAFIGDGVLINSGEFDGLDSVTAKAKIIEHLKEKGLAETAINYRLRDWLISRQRYWGAPIPIIYCKKCGEVPVPEKDLPVKLPEDVEFRPAGESLLKSAKDFVNIKCPKCGGKAQRETDTMDTFVDSAWYYLRFTDPKNENEFAAKSKISHWMPVDTYVGGIEHAILHLLYARFISKALHRLKIIDYNKNGEPFKKLFNIGMIYLHGAKMSKSKGNIVSPDELIQKYGADALRGYELFIGPAAQDSHWQISGISGVYRFLEKVWDLYNSIDFSSSDDDAQVERTIKIVTDEITSIRPNTSISHLMELFNDLKSAKSISKSSAEKIIIIMAPFFPHLAEELWQKMGNEDSIFAQGWPKWNEKLVKLDRIKIAVQINGKVKKIIEVQTDISQQDLERKSKESLGKIAKIAKIIYVPGRVINFVIR